MQSRITKELVLDALLMALWRRNPKSQVLVHSDQGSQYTSHDWSAFLKAHGLQGSMSRRGNCHDNVVAESFFQLLKRERIRRRERLKVPHKQPKRGHLWLNDGSCIRLRPTHPQHVWSYDFFHYATDDGRSLKVLTLIDEVTRECLAIRVGRGLRGLEVIETLADDMLIHGIPEHIRSDNGPEMTSKRVRN